MLNTSLQWCKVCAYMQHIRRKTCAKCVGKDYLSCILLQMLQILRYLLVCCAKGAELASFTVHSWSFLDVPSLLVMGADLANFASFVGVVGELREIWLIRSNFLVFSVDGQRSVKMN